MRAPSLIAALLIAIAAPLPGADVHFRDGRIWAGVRVLHQEPTYLLVMHDRGIYTVLPEDLTEEAAATIGIRMPTAEELEARQKKASKPAPASALQETSVAKVSSVVESGVGREVVAASQTPAREPQVVEEFSSIVAPQRSLPIVRLSGRVLARLANGAIIRADGMPPNHDHGDVGWVVGTIYLREDGRLNATYRGAPLSGRVAPDGEHRYTDSQGAIHVLSAWRLE